MMQFRKTKQDLVRILGNAARGRFTVVGYQVQVIDSSEILGDKRRVQVFYGEGEFPKGKAGLSSSTQHEATYRIELGVSAASKVNLKVLNNVDATDKQREAALECFVSSSELADDSIDELMDIVYQILMDGRNIDVGSEGPPFVVADRWVGGLSKDDPVPQGEHVELTGSVRFTCQLTEEVTGDTGVAAAQPAFNITDDLIGDDNEKTGSLAGEDP